MKTPAIARGDEEASSRPVRTRPRARPPERRRRESPTDAPIGETSGDGGGQRPGERTQSEQEAPGARGEATTPEKVVRHEEPHGEPGGVGQELRQVGDHETRHIGDRGAPRRRRPRRIHLGAARQPGSRQGEGPHGQGKPCEVDHPPAQEADEGATRERPDDHAEARRKSEPAERASPAASRGRESDEGRRARENERRRGPLEGPRHEKPTVRGGRAAQEIRRAAGREPGPEDPGVADPVREPAGRQSPRANVAM